MATIIRVGLLVMVTGQLGRIPVLSAGAKEAPVLINDLFVVGAVVAGLLVAARNRRLELDGTAALAVLFAAVGAGSAVLAMPRFGLSAYEFVFSTAYLVRWLVYFGLYVACLNFVRKRDVFAVWGTLELAILVFAVFGIFQAIFLPGFAQIIYPESEVYLDWDPQGHRLVSTFIDPNFAGALLFMGLLMLAAFASYGVPVAKWKLLVLFGALVATLSRSSLLALLVGGLIILAVRGTSKRLWQMTGLIVALTLPALPFLLQFAASFNKLELDASALGRVVSWLAALEIFMEHPIIGVGFNTYGFVQESYGQRILGQASFGLDGGILFIAVMTGLVGSIVYLAMLGSVAVRCRRLWSDVTAAPAERAFGLGVVAATVGLCVHSFFLNSLLYPFLMQPLWVLWALSAVLARRKRAGDVIDPVPAPRHRQVPTHP